MSRWNRNEPDETDSVQEEVEGTVEQVQEIQEVVVEEEPAAPVEPAEPRFVIKVGDNKWLKSWSPSFELCDDKSEAIVLNSDWARGHRKRVIGIKRMKAEIFPV